MGEAREKAGGPCLRGYVPHHPEGEARRPWCDPPPGLQQGAEAWAEAAPDRVVVGATPRARDRVALPGRASGGPQRGAGTHLVVRLALHVDAVDLDQAVSGAQRGRLGWGARLHAPDELPAAALLAVQVEAVALLAAHQVAQARPQRLWRGHGAGCPPADHGPATALTAVRGRQERWAARRRLRRRWGPGGVLGGSGSAPVASGSDRSSGCGTAPAPPLPRPLSAPPPPP